MGISPTLNIPQARFLAMQHKFKAYVAGFGSGKTWVGCGGICKGMWEHPKINQGYFAPTYPQIRDIFYPTIEEVAFDWGLSVKINEGNKEVHFYEGRRYRGTTICRSMEKPGSIVGFKIGNAMVDELDVMAAAKAQQAWRKIIARMRYKVDGLRNGIDVTTTPEGFKFVYQQFVKAVREKPELAALYGLIQASTFDNAKNLPPDYIPSLLSSYPDELIQAYLRGKFTNLNSGTIYHTFNRKLNNCSDEIQDGDPLFIGMDFNVGKMAAIVHVKRNGLPCAVRELVKVYDEINKAIIRTGNIAGTSALQIMASSQSIAASTGATIGTVQSLMTELVGMGSLTQQQLEKAAGSTALAPPLPIRKSQPAKQPQSFYPRLCFANSSTHYFLNRRFIDCSWAAWSITSPDFFVQKGD